ncbi:hypothetical protein ACFQE1_02180 [Halobium palmae]|uniref:Uncharacterized protein n=1 Tax=Halobium palmae TaxID=1776492 RepID=A0ABD5RUW8_9EURY
MAKSTEIPELDEEEIWEHLSYLNEVARTGKGVQAYSIYSIEDGRRGGIRVCEPKDAPEMDDCITIQARHTDMPEDIQRRFERKLREEN